MALSPSILQVDSPGNGQLKIMVISINVKIEKITPFNQDDILLQNIAFEVSEPGLIWIQGPNGSGKSLLASVISGKALFEGSGLDVHGSIKLITSKGEFIAEKSKDAQAFVSNVDYLPQKLGASLLALHHQDDICFGIEGRFHDIQGTTNKEKDKRAIKQLTEILDCLDLQPHLTKSLGECSYGETRRLEFAGVLSSRASLVVLDEPFSGLDPTKQEIIKKVLSEFPISHDSIWIVTCHESPEKYGLKPNKVINLEHRQQASLETFSSIAQIVIKRFGNNKINTINPIEIKDLKITRKKNNKQFIISLPFLYAKPKTVTWLDGNNGEGKSSVALFLSGLLANSNINKVIIEGEMKGGPFNGKIPKAPNKKIRLVLQSPYKSFLHNTLERDLLSPTSPLETIGSDRLNLSVDFREKIEKGWGGTNRRALAFSFGQLRFLQLLLIPTTVEVLIIDEPLLGIHPDLHETLLSVLNSIAESGRIVICTCESGLCPSRSNIYKLSPTQVI